MEKDPEPAVDAITTWFSTMFGSASAFTSWSSQTDSLGLHRARIEDRKVVLPRPSRALSQPRPDRWLQPPPTHVLPHLTTMSVECIGNEVKCIEKKLLYAVSLRKLALA